MATAIETVRRLPTIGPWLAKGDQVEAAADANDGYFVAVTHGSDWQANASLIAAAPELLDRLENLVIAIGMGWDLEAMVGCAKSAIAKARGESS